MKVDFTRNKITNLRAISAKIIFDVLRQKQSLNSALTNHIQLAKNEKDYALIQEICFGVIRVLPELEFYVQSLMNKPLSGKNQILHELLLVGIYQIQYTRIPHHAAVAETVNAVCEFKRDSLKGLVNGVLRNFLRQQADLKIKFEHSENNSLHPNWLLQRIKLAYPKQWQNIVQVNNQKPPMWIRVNQLQYSVQEYLQMLRKAEIEAEISPDLNYALKLITPVNAHRLPEFATGAITIQDVSAQYAAHLLAPQNGEYILDMCAAPGGKTTHILELAPQAKVLAVDNNEQRLKRIDENLARLNLAAEVKVGDGLTPEKWLKDEQYFDRILLDAPCSATGIIRRHPDIKWLRRNSDIAELAQLQYQILTNMWKYLKPNGTLVYATCSILPDENQQQIDRFLQAHNDAKLVDNTMQFLPDELAGDGFFYAKLVKMP